MCTAGEGCSPWLCQPFWWPAVLVLYEPRISRLPGKPWYLILWTQYVFLNAYFASIFRCDWILQSLSVKECFLISTWNPPFVKSTFSWCLGYFISNRSPQALRLSHVGVCHMCPHLQATKQHSLPTLHPFSTFEPTCVKVDFFYACSWTDPYWASEPAPPLSGPALP